MEEFRVRVCVRIVVSSEKWFEGNIFILNVETCVVVLAPHKSMYICNVAKAQCALFLLLSSK